jgi:hypothetical protein
MKLKLIFPEIVVLFTVLTVACNDIPKIGIIKNTSNGITTTYRNIVTEEVIKVMNGEQFNHNQIPLGESFEVISRNVERLTIKNNRVNVGCELTISDKGGNILLNMNDLFGDSETLHKDSVDFLRCTVNSGSPMNPGEFYDVEIRYWDKLGDGELTNKLEVAIIEEI